MPTFQISDWVSFVIVGVLTAYFVSYIMKDRAFGWLGNLILGVAGALVGPVLYFFVMKLIGNQYDVLDPLPAVELDHLVKAMIGAFILLLIFTFIRRKRK